MQQSPTMMVYRFMNMSKKLLLLVAGITGLSGCASTDGAARDREPDVSQIAKTIGCRQDEVAICIEVNCEPEEYYCTNRGDVQDMFKAGEFRH
jgi:hypothetical protein